VTLILIKYTIWNLFSFEGIALSELQKQDIPLLLFFFWYNIPLLLYLSQLNYFIYLSQLINGNEIKKCKVYNMSRVRPVSNHHRHYHATRHSNTAPPRQLIKRHVITLRVSDQSSAH
jgi:hypothetical protein